MDTDAPSVALAEWAAVCAALSTGETLITVRKGGIHERGGGVFAPEHRRFWLLPSFEHQRADRLIPAVARYVAADPQPGFHALPAWADVARTWRVTDPDRLAALGDLLPFSHAETMARFLYRESPFIFVLALRVQRLALPAVIPDRPRYAGCRSWIELDDQPQPGAALPAISDEDFAAKLKILDDTLRDPWPVEPKPKLARRA